MLSGEGFKLGMGETSVDSTQFTAVVGGSDWSVGLTAVELNDFVLVGGARGCLRSRACTHVRPHVLRSKPGSTMRLPAHSYNGCRR